MIEGAPGPGDADAQSVGEDDPELLGKAARSLETDPTHAEEDVAESAPPGGEAVTETDGTSDTAAITESPSVPANVAPVEQTLPDASTDMSAHKIVVALKRIEAEVRSILDDKDTKRKRKLAGTRRWHELEEDIIAWRHGRGIDEQTLRHLQELIATRHHLFNRLRFIAGTRPTWNT